MNAFCGTIYFMLLYVPCIISAKIICTPSYIYPLPSIEYTQKQIHGTFLCSKTEKVAQCDLDSDQSIVINLFTK